MEKKIIEATINTPKVVLDPENNEFEISGESRPKDIPKFYKPILLWLEEFGQNLTEQQEDTSLFEFNFSFEYFNSLSAKFILDICKKLSWLRSNGNNIIVKWHYEEDDDDMYEVGQEMSRISRLPFEYVEIKL
jgi:hypothetical protein